MCLIFSLRGRRKWSQRSRSIHTRGPRPFSVCFLIYFLLGFYFYFRFRSCNILQIAGENSGMAGKIGMMNEPASGTYRFYNFNNVTVTATIIIRLYWWTCTYHTLTYNTPSFTLSFLYIRVCVGGGWGLGKCPIIHSIRTHSRSVHQISSLFVEF